VSYRDQMPGMGVWQWGIPCPEVVGEDIVPGARMRRALQEGQ